MQGVVQKAERTIFYQRIQNVVLSRGLIARQFDVAGISFETAAQLGARKSEREESATLWKIMGFDHTQVTIPGLKIANAISLKKLLLERIEQVSGKNDNSGL
jgi:membrane protein YdbS with pleckstrin-like domain